MYGHPMFCFARDWFGVALVLAAWAGSSAEARAQSEPAPTPSAEQVSRARAAFAQGIELADLRRWREAADKFRQVIGVRDTAAVRYNLGVALVELQEYAEAEDILQGITFDDPGPQTQETKKQVEALLRKIEARSGTLKVELAGVTHGAYVTLDGRELSEERLGTNIHVRPGSHVIVAERGGKEVARAEVTVTERGAQSVRVVVPPVGAAPNVSVEPKPKETRSGVAHTRPPPEKDDSVPLRRNWKFWTVLGAVLVAGAAAGVTYVLLRDDETSAAAAQGDFNPPVLEFR